MFVTFWSMVALFVAVLEKFVMPPVPVILFVFSPPVRLSVFVFSIPFVAVNLLASDVNIPLLVILFWLIVPSPVLLKVPVLDKFPVPFIVPALEPPPTVAVVLLFVKVAPLETANVPC